MTYCIAFSPTGGTGKAAEALCKVIDGKHESIELCIPASEIKTPVLSADDIVVIAAPVFGGRIPALSAERIASIKGNGARCVIMAVYGNRAYDDALAEMQDIATSAGFSLVAAVAAVAEHSIVREYGAARPDAQDIQELEAFGKNIAQYLKDGKTAGTLSIPGNRPYKKAGAGPVPSAGKACKECGICAKGCPTGAISLSDLKHSDKSKCISCMKCISVCPSGARAISPVMHFMVKTMLKSPCKERKALELFI